MKIPKLTKLTVSFVAAYLSGVDPLFADCTQGDLSTLPFDPARLSEHVRILASDEFAGRAPASAGETKTIEYLSKQFAALGLQPAGAAGGWTQEVPLRKFELARAPKVSLKENGVISELKYDDEVAGSSIAGEPHIDIKNAPIVFVGYGVTAPEVGWDDFKGIDLKGKIAIILMNDPDFESPAPGKFGGRAMTFYGRSVYKYSEAARRGALAAFIVHEDASATVGWTTIKNSWDVTQFDIDRAAPRQSHPLIEGWLRRDVASRLLKKAGLDLDDLKQRAMQASFAPVELRGAQLSLRADIEITPVLSHNVIGRLAGTSSPGQSVIYGAHWDQMGTGTPDSTGDRVYHGAIDNASGVAGLLELARVFATNPPTARSLYFVAFTGEEIGLLGSEYYALHPPAPLEQTAAVFNMDIFLPHGPACDVAIRGRPNNTLHEALTAVVKKQGRSLSPDAHLEAGYFYRSDHFPFAKLGVPAVSIMSGQNLYQGGVAAGEKAYQEYMTHRYHQQSDRWSSDLDLRGEALDLDVLYKAGRDIANSDAWPQWFAASEFKRIRDQTARARERKK